ncbi:MAG: tetratricopeptide repeat protein [Candidatus Competibacteraceae bacterium]|nr:tetratricopeptide repeat protein [Candidatus Competibacteraceae bacterium]
MSDDSRRFLAQLGPGIFFLSILILCLAIYWPGLSGDFLFDDQPNLQALGAYNGVTNLKHLGFYLNSGIAGPSGRPLSLLSFLINDNNWPSVAEPFKYTNVLLHLLNGCLLYWVIFRLLRLGEAQSSLSQAGWIAALGTACWLLHPFNVSTTLYIVQRMVQICTTFTLLGLLAYLHGRALLTSNPSHGYVWMTAGVLGGTTLATLGKENGVLLPLLVIVIEYSVLHRVPSPGPTRIWRWWALGAPIVAVVAYMLWSITPPDAAYNHRSFSLEQRLLSEGRILVEYLHYLLVPHSQTRGLFHDSYTFSSSWLDPPSTLFAWLLLLALFLVGLWSRCRYPWLSLALLFFLAGHLLESTVLPLELYFEHRNYLPAMFLFLPLAHFLIHAHPRYSVASFIGITTLLLVLSWTTWYRTSLWGKSNELLLVWASANPNSARAQSHAAEALAQMGHDDLAIESLVAAIQNIPTNLSLRIHYLLRKSLFHGVTPTEFEQGLTLASNLPCEPSAFLLLRQLVDATNEGLVQGIAPSDAHRFLDALAHNPDCQHSPEPKHLLAYMHGLLYLAQQQPGPALESFEQSLLLHGDVEVGLRQSAILASKGFLQQALVHLRSSELVLQRQVDTQLKRPRTDYQMEIERLRRLFTLEMTR